MKCAVVTAAVTTGSRRRHQDLRVLNLTHVHFGSVVEVRGQRGQIPTLDELGFFFFGREGGSKVTTSARLRSVTATLCACINLVSGSITIHASRLFLIVTTGVLGAQTRTTAMTSRLQECLQLSPSAMFPSSSRSVYISPPLQSYAGLFVQPVCPTTKPSALSARPSCRLMHAVIYGKGTR